MRSKKDKHGLWLFGAVGAGFVAIFAAVALNSGKAKPGPDNCVGVATANTVVVLDHSEQVTQQTRDEVLARAMAYIREHVAINERVTVFSISDHSRKALRPDVSLCRPPEDGSRLTESVKLIRTRFQNNFEKPLRDVLATTPLDGKESPIAQALTDISLTAYLRGNSNTLLIFSDMLEHTEKFSLYACSDPKNVIARYKASRQGAQERPEFKNTTVVLNLIPRLDQSKVTLKCRDALWPWFFGNNAGTQAGLTFDYLPGGTSMSPGPQGAEK